jgi:hypothetical protein
VFVGIVVPVITEVYLIGNVPALEPVGTLRHTTVRPVKKHVPPGVASIPSFISVGIVYPAGITAVQVTVELVCRLTPQSGLSPAN